jgi:hypothetical protein
MTVFAALAGLMQVRRDWTPTLAQGGAMFAVAAPMLPAPDLSLAAMGTRAEAVCVGFLVATGLFGLLSCLTPFPQAETKKWPPGTEDLIFLEMTKSNQYEDVSLNQWLTRLLPALVQATLASDEEMKRDLG